MTTRVPASELPPTDEKEAEFISDRISMMVSAIQADKQKEILAAYGRCKTDDDRFSSIWELPSVHEVIEIEPEYHSKSSAEASQFRESGNRYFQSKSYLSALEAYNRCIVHAPEWREGREGENLLALAYANRSATLLHLKRYHDSLDDIDMALESGYPTDSLYKLQDRRAKCYLGLGNKSKASDNFLKAFDTVQSSGLKEQVIDAWKAAINTQLAACEALDETEDVPDDPGASRTPDVLHGPQEQYPALSSATAVQYSKKKGRQVVATETIGVGDVVMTERPYASVLLPAHHATHCYRCMVRIDRPVPCKQCASVRYCSRECRTAAWDGFHQYECRFYAVFDTLLLARIGHLAVRIAMVAGLRFLLEFHQNQKNKLLSGTETSMDELHLKEGKYPGDYNNIYNLETHSKDHFTGGLFNYGIVAAFLTKILVASGFFTQEDEDLCSTENIIAVGGMVLRHLQIIQCNANRLQELVPGCRFEEPKSTMIGCALYPTAALVNHSCDQVVDHNYLGDRTVLRAVRNISPGEEITTSYGPVFYDTTYKARQQQLLYCYFFKCECDACEEDWPSVDKLADCTITFRCESCKTALDLSLDPHKTLVSCQSCGHQVNVQEVVGQLELSHEQFAAAMSDVAGERYEEAIVKLKGHMDMLQKYLCQPWRDFTSCQACIIHCYRILESRK